MTAVHGWGRRLAPMIVLQIFLWLTIFLYASGPWQWPMRDPSKLYLFVAGCHVSLFIGYLTAAHRAPRKRPEDGREMKLVTAALWVSVLVLPITTFARTGRWMPDIVRGLTDPGQAYAEAHLYSSTTANPAAYLRILGAPLLVLLIPLSVYYWARLSKPMRLIVISIMAATILLSLATGQRRDIADLLMIAPFAAMAAHWAGVTRWRRDRIVAAVMGGVVVASAFIAYFVYSHVSRVGEQTAAAGVNSTTMQLPDFDNPILKSLPAELQPGWLGLVNYLSTGYYGLSLALDRDYQPMYGFGHSMFLTRNFSRLANDPSFESRSYAVQISDKDGFRYPVFWCTAYPYFANDIGFAGVIIALFFLGRALALSWIDSIGGHHPYAVVMFSLLLTLAFYLPATNRMLQDGEGVVAFYSWLAVWLSSRARTQTAPSGQAVLSS